MIHVVFNEADVQKMHEVILLDESLAGQVIQIKDDFAVGPINDLYTEDGRENRFNWWKGIMDGSHFDIKIGEGKIDDHQTALELVERLKTNPEESIWIWAAQNGHDVCGYYWLLYYFKEFQGRVHILYLNNLPFINEKGNIFYPEWLYQIQATEFVKAKKLAREITLSEFEVDPDEWKKLSEENKGVRRLEGGKKIISFGYEYFDNELKKYITNDFQKASKIISQFLQKSKETSGDVFLYWRLNTLVEEQKLVAQGDRTSAKEYEIKLV